MPEQTPSQDCPRCGRFVQDRPNYGLHCECGWKKLRGSRAASGEVVSDREPAVRPFPDGRDPDEFHAACRERMFAHHPGPPQTIVAGGYGLEPGDRITWRRTVWTITGAVRLPTNTGHTLALETADGTRQQVKVPWTFTGWHRDRAEWVEILTSDHYPACGHCGQPWPCREVDEGFVARQAVDALVNRIAHETDHPWPCVWCGRWTRHGERRFKTERGMKQHLRTCRANPANWDETRWVIRFDDNLRASGGYDPRHHTPPDDSVAIFRAVRAAALEGRLPDRLSDLDWEQHRD